jgi:hypothetical protein
VSQQRLAAVAVPVIAVAAVVMVVIESALAVLVVGEPGQKSVAVSWQQ